MMKNILYLIIVVSINFCYAQTTNLVSNGTMEIFRSPNFAPSDWSSSSDAGSFNQNTTDFIEGTSSVQFTPLFDSPLNMFTTAPIALNVNQKYTISYQYKYLGPILEIYPQINTILFVSGESFENQIVAQNNSSWNEISYEYTPQMTDTDVEFQFIVQGERGLEDEEFSILIDNVRIFAEKLVLSNQNFSLQKELTLLLSSKNSRLIQLENKGNIRILNASLYTITGKQLQLNHTNNFSEFDLSTMASGAYFINFTTNKGRVTKKIILQ